MKSKYQDRSDYLNSYGVMNMRIRRLEADAEELHDTFDNAKYYFGKGYFNSDLYKNLKREFMQIEMEKQKAILQQNKVKATIMSVPEDDLRQLLCMRYIDGIVWDKIADALGYSYEYIRGEKNRSALRKIQIPS